MKKTVKLLLVLLLFCSCFARCSLSEKIDTEIIRCPQDKDTLIVHPWDPNPEDPNQPPVGH